MTTLQRTAIGATLAAAVGTGIYEAHRNFRLRAEVQTLQQQQVPLTENIQQLTRERDALSRMLAMADTNAASKGFKWEAVEAPDYKQYIANLRAVGCPEQTIRDIIITDLDRTYAQRMAKLYSYTAKNYWRAPNPNTETRDHVQRGVIQEEKRAVIRELLGIDPDEEAVRRTGGLVNYEEGFEFLSAEKRRQLREIDREYQVKLMAINGAMPYAQVRDPQQDASRRLELEAWKDTAIEKLLTPQELDEREMLQSAHANGLRWATQAFEPSEQEFRSIFQIEKRFGKDNYLGSSGFENPTPADAESERQFQAALKQALGEERYADYQLSKDLDYSILYGVVRDNELPKETTRTVYDLHQAAEQRAAAIRNDASLSPEGREAAFQQLGEQTDREIAKLLGDSGFRLYKYQIVPQRDWSWRHAYGSS